MNGLMNFINWEKSMKKSILLILICCLFLACHRGLPSESEYSFIALERPKYDSSWTWRSGIGSNTGDFYPRGDYKANAYIDESKTISDIIQVDVNEIGNGRYLLDGKLYFSPQHQDRTRVAWGEAYGWWVDRNFFYQYAITKEGGTLYRNTNIDSLETVVYVTEDGEEHLLFENGSSLIRPETLKIEDFGAVVMYDTVFAKAEDFATVLYAHGNGKEGVLGGLESIEEDYVWDLNFECSKVPGLRYEINLIVDSNKTNGYVYAVNNGEMCSFELEHLWIIPPIL